MTICFHVNSGKSRAFDVRDELSAYAQSLGFGISDDSPDAVVVLGGDGTLLSAVHHFPGIPLLGLNLGSLGYLSDVEEPSFKEALRHLLVGDYSISRRTALTVRDHVALNDVVVSRGISGHAAVIELAVDDHVATTFFADGLLIATPTGSTAYSLSAGGPILSLDSESFVVTPICPHALTSRPLVVRDSSRFSLRLRPRPGAEELEIFADGESLGRLNSGDVLNVMKANSVVPLIQLSEFDPFAVLNRKLGWSGSLIG